MPVDFKKSDMLYKYTSTKANGDNPLVRGKIDAIRLDRDEQHEVYDYIVSYLKRHLKVVNVANGQKAEKIIQEKIPRVIVLKTEITKALSAEWVKI
jgi:hypothetical protein